MVISNSKLILIIRFMLSYKFLFYRSRGLLSGYWTNYPAHICPNRDQHHRRLAIRVQTRKWFPWNSKPNCSPGYLNCHHPEELHNSSPQNCEDRKAVCPLHVHLLHPAMGIILHNEENNLHGLLLHTKFGTLQYPLPSKV